jgi:hypothetical protein
LEGNQSFLKIESIEVQTDVSLFVVHFLNELPFNGQCKEQINAGVMFLLGNAAYQIPVCNTTMMNGF